MDWKFTNEFADDLETYDYDKEFIKKLLGKIKEIEKADSFHVISGMEQIRKRKSFYRFKISEDRITYRIGVKVLRNKVWLTVIDTYKKRFYERI